MNGQWSRCLKRSILEGALTLGLMTMCLLPAFATTVTPTMTPAPTTNEQESAKAKSEDTLEKIKKDAKTEIAEYAQIVQIKTDGATAEKIDKIVKRYQKIIGKADGNKNEEGLTSEDSIEDCITEAKGAIDALAQGKDDEKGDDDKLQPSSTSEFIMVGGNWVTPEVTHGQLADLVLPVVNMGVANLNNVTVTPVISNAVGEWPFVIETSGYTQTIQDLPGIGNGQSDMDRRRELTWNLRVRDDAMSGYYKIQFNVLYYIGAEAESCTLTTYIKVHGAKGSGNIENEGGGTSTPRVIVTGFMTDPAKVHAGDTFTLTLHLKNTSQRTAVSNMLLTFSAPTEGSELDSSYAVFLPTSGSNSVYVSEIGKGAEQDVSIELSAKNDLSQKPYQIDVSMEFEDEEYASFTASADVTIPIYQDARFELSKPEVLPDQISVGSEANVMFSIYNLGKTTLHNVHVSFEEDFVSGGDSFLGKIEAGGTASVDAMVTGAKETKNGDVINVVISYENDAGTLTEYRQPIDLTVVGGTQLGEGGDMPEWDYEEIDYEEEQKGVSPVLIAVVVLLVVVILIVVLVLFLKKRREKKEEMSLLSDLEREQGEDSDDEIS